MDFATADSDAAWRDTITGLPVIAIGDDAFWKCDIVSVTIPNSVTSIGTGAFSLCGSLTNVTIGDSVTNIGNYAFADDSLFHITIGKSVTRIGANAFLECTNLRSVSIGKGVISIGDRAFGNCVQLPSVTIPNSVTSIGTDAFCLCGSLTNVTIGHGVTNIGDGAFRYSYSLQGVYFEGNAPNVGSSVFDSDYGAIVYYLPGTTSWGPTFGGLPTTLWVLPNPVILDFEPSFGVHSNGFSFLISWATNRPVAVEACTNLTNPIWSPVSTNTLSNGSSYFSDPQWANYPSRFYRLRSP